MAADGHRPVGDLERLQALRVAQERDPLFDAVGGDIGPVEQFLGCVLAPRGQRRRSGTLLLDPIPVLNDEAAELGLCVRPIGKLAEGLHRQFDARDIRRGHPFDFGLRESSRSALSGSKSGSSKTVSAATLCPTANS